jgi:RimJ/RimL family protein N-acetyltransferase
VSAEVALRDVVQEDIPIFFEHQADPAATELAAFPARDREAFTAHWARILADRTVVAKTVVADGEVAGNVLSFVHDGRREVGYWLGRDHWGKGIATEALAEFLPVVGERPLFAGVARHNAPSIRVLEKCGFAVVGEDGDHVILELR